jgi:hypothetical protein
VPENYVQALPQGGIYLNRAKENTPREVLQGKISAVKSRITPKNGDAGCVGCNPCPLSDDDIRILLVECGGDVEQSSYRACMMLADCGQIRLADGTVFSSEREYWLALAALYRPKKSRSLRRADEIHG